ncbi:hypothetical protein [Bradyrhizobium sp.]|uniref:hypothetical protein n=1 Tax=Bradyrhizobium sp. TaxID=376 RepID=UPI002730BED7|nr:hypothetical protein [Bradyrhizobium sp.]MDP1866083.1 hypothetical protein [Bradyrhizobium sp.]MDP3074946.1 hypothetical protein [Bradyrhizobium sp.]
MKKLAISLMAGAGALLATSAFAAPLSNGIAVLPESNIEQVRLVCNENGRCWRERSQRRVVVRESYGYDRGHHYGHRNRGYDRGHRDGVGIRAPGVSIGIGSGRY